MKPPLRVTVAPKASNAIKCVSILRRPITSPPGGGSSTLPKRAKSGPASSSEARILAASSLSTTLVFTPRVSTISSFLPIQDTSLPKAVSISRNVRTSSILGTLRSVTGPSDNSVAAKHGSAAFLLPAGLIRPSR